MALWQREVIGQHLPERLLDLTHQQTGLARQPAGRSHHRLLRGRHRAARRRCRAAHARRAARAARRRRGGMAMGPHPPGALASSGRRRRVRYRPARGRWRIAHAAQHRRRTAAARREFRRRVPHRGRFRRRRIRFLQCRTSAIPACRAARTTRISSSPGCAASTTRCICVATVSKPIARAPRSSSRAESNIQTATPRYSWLAPAARELPRRSSADCRR